MVKKPKIFQHWYNSMKFTSVEFRACRSGHENFLRCTVWALHIDFSEILNMVVWPWNNLYRDIQVVLSEKIIQLWFWGSRSDFTKNVNFRHWVLNCIYGGLDLSVLAIKMFRVTIESLLYMWLYIMVSFVIRNSAICEKPCLDWPFRVAFTFKFMTKSTCRP